MKQILITLLTFFTLANTAIAQFKLEITPSNVKHAKMEKSCVDKADCDKKLLKWIRKQKVYKGKWDKIEANSIVSKSIKDMEDNTVIKYFHPSNFSINRKPTLAIIAQEKADELERENERNNLKSLDVNNFDKKQGESVAEYRTRIAKILKKIVKRLKRL